MLLIVIFPQILYKSSLCIFSSILKIYLSIDHMSHSLVKMPTKRYLQRVSKAQSLKMKPISFFRIAQVSMSAFAGRQTRDFDF